MSKLTLSCALLAGLLPLVPPALRAEEPVVGSRNTAVADPGVARPATKPVVVPLFSGLTFADFQPKPFPYAPPAGGPWAKVVLEADFDVTAGRQFDRTTTLWIGGVCLFYGTTQEPSKGVPQRWHVERDVTDYAALLGKARTGRAELGTVVDSTYDGVLHGSARLLFYPATEGAAAPAVPDRVLPLSEGEHGGTVTLASSASRLARTFTLPRNVERAYLDVYTKSESKDEFWYTDLPSEAAPRLEVNRAPGLREVEVFLDGRPAGLAPVFPLIFTGGMDPLLWRPIPAVQTFCFEPWRVDLTPFAALLSDGRPHEVSLGVRNAKDYFSATAALLLHLDPGAAEVKGALTANTLQGAPAPEVVERLGKKGEGLEGSVSVDSRRSFRIAGYVDTSHGRVRTELEQDFACGNHQSFSLQGGDSLQEIRQTLEVASVTRTGDSRGERVETVRTRFPLKLRFRGTKTADGISAQETEVLMAHAEQRDLALDGFPQGSALRSSTVESRDTAIFDGKGRRTGSRGAHSRQECVQADSEGRFYRCRIESADGAVTAFQRESR